MGSIGKSEHILRPLDRHWSFSHQESFADRYCSVADIKTWPWVKNWERSGFSKEQVQEFPHLLKWIDRIAERPAVQRGIGESYVKK